MLDRAKQHYLAFLLNVASGRIRTYDSVTEDGVTTSQTLQYIASLISDGLESNDGIAEDISETINNGALLEAGVVPPEIPDIPYRSPVVAQSTFLTAIGEVSPSPVRDHARIAFSLAHPSEVMLGVYDVEGSLVVRLSEGVLSAGEHEAVWNGRDAEGRRTSSGVYYIQLWVDGRKYSRSVHVMR